jgi:hypothetical protein
MYSCLNDYYLFNVYMYSSALMRKLDFEINRKFNAINSNKISR